jgi:NDP-sugar pyrophosphorylase family protein
MKDIQTFIMAAGFGTRLKPLTLAVPKPMVLVANKPIMQYNIELLHRSGIGKACANLHYFPEQIEDFFGDGSAFGVDLRYSFEEKLLGTAGGVRKMADLASDVSDTFLVLSSDALTDINLEKLVSYHKRKGALATIALYSVLDTSQFGVVILDDEGRVKAFQEKPLVGKALSNLANTGIYVFEPEILDMIPKGKFHDFGKQLFPKLAKEKKGIYGYQMDEYWSDVGSIEQYFVANADVINGNVKTSLRKGKSSDQVVMGLGAKIDDGVEIVGPSVIGDRCVITRGSTVKQSIIWPDSTIGAGSRIDESIIGSWAHLENKVRIHPGCVVGNRCRISSGRTLQSGARVDPDSHI